MARRRASARSSAGSPASPAQHKSARAPARRSTRASTRPARRLVQADDLLRLQGVSQPRLSPDGRRVVFVVKSVGDKNDYRTNLWLADVERGTAARFTSGDKDSAPAWSPDGRTIAFISGRTKGRPQIALIAAEGGEARALSCFPEGSLGSFRWSPDGRCLLASFRELDPDWTEAAVEARKAGGASDPPRVIDDPLYRFDGDGYFNAQRYHLYVVDAESGEHRLLYDKSKVGVTAYDIAPDGKQVALITSRDRFGFARSWTHEVVRVALPGGRVTPVEGLPVGSKDALRWSPDGRHLAVSCQPDSDGRAGGKNVQLFVADLARGTARSLTAEHDYCLVAPTIADASEVEFSARFEWSPDGKHLWLQVGWHGACHLLTVAARGGPLRVHTRGDAQHALGSLSADGRRMALVIGDATHPGELHVADVPAPAALERDAVLAPRRLSHLNDALLAELQLSVPRAHWVSSADGTRVHVFTMLPPSRKRTPKLPTLLQVHGGPHTQYGFAFFHEFQLLAAQGYAVVFSNPRGSKGYGEAHCDGISGAWGTRDWEDLQAVIADMRRQPWCDSRRLGISGGSFGGYMTLWAVGHTQEFAAAVADRCVANMVSMWGASDVYVWPDSYFPGNTWDDTRALWDMSPLKHLGKCRTPTLLIHSEGDLRCNVAESDQAYAALAVRGVPVRYVRYPRNTSHGMSRGGPPDMRLHRLGQYLAWWAQWLGQGGKARGRTGGRGRRAPGTRPSAGAGTRPSARTRRARA